MRGESFGPRVAAAGPPVKTTLGESLVTEPEPLAIIDKHFDGGAASIPKAKDHACERVVPKRLLALSDQAVYPVAKIRGLDGHQDLHLWRDSQHYG